MRAFVTGGTGFLGGRLVERLSERGDDVVALVRSPAPAKNVLDAAVEAGVARAVYVSTNSVAGDTEGQVVDEQYERPPGPFLSVYDDTKLAAHRAAEERIARGAPVIIVQPGGIYGPGDHTEVGRLLERAFHGKPVVLAFGSVGLNWGQVDDVVQGLLLAHDRGRVGETYILGGELATLRQAVERAYAVGGHGPRIVSVPTSVLLLASPLALLLGRNVREYASASDGVTYWGVHAKARRELGYAPAGLDEGLRRTFARE